MAVMKQVVLNLSQRRNDPPERGPKSPRTPRKAGAGGKAKKTVVHHPHAVMFEGEDGLEENIHKPAPTQFVSLRINMLFCHPHVMAHSWV